MADKSLGTAARRRAHAGPLPGQAPGDRHWRVATELPLPIDWETEPKTLVREERQALRTAGHLSRDSLAGSCLSHTIRLDFSIAMWYSKHTKSAEFQHPKRVPRIRPLPTKIAQNVHLEYPNKMCKFHIDPINGLHLRTFLIFRTRRVRTSVLVMQAARSVVGRSPHCPFYKSMIRARIRTRRRGNPCHFKTMTDRGMKFRHKSRSDV